MLPSNLPHEFDRFVVGFIVGFSSGIHGPWSFFLLTKRYLFDFSCGKIEIIMIFKKIKPKLLIVCKTE